MKTKDNHISKILNIMFMVLLLGVILFLVIGESVMPKENPTGRGKSALFEAQWERVLPDGSREQIGLPTNCDAARGETVRIETILAQNQQDTWMCMRASQQDMYVYVDGKLRMEYCTKESRLFGKDSASAFVFFEIKDEDAGKVLAIETVSRCEYAGFLNEIYVSKTIQEADIASELIRQIGKKAAIEGYQRMSIGISSDRRDNLKEQCIRLGAKYTWTQGLNYCYYENYEWRDLSVFL